MTETPKKIIYVRGDATAPIGNGKKIIAHICNDCVPGKWGAGFVLSLSRRWKEPEREYRAWSARWDPRKPYDLGEVQFVNAEDDIVVANMVAQHGVGSVGGVSPIRYDALKKCLEKVAVVALEREASVHCPKIGSGLARGDWKTIEKIIDDALASKGVGVTIYEFVRG